MSQFNKPFSSHEYWNLLYDTGGNSGHGSYGEHAENKSHFVNQFLEESQVKSVIEFGCGDSNQLGYYKVPEYLGLDVSQTAVQLCQEKFKSDPHKSFMLTDTQYFYNNGNLLKADVTFSIEVLFHLIEEEVWRNYLNALFTTAEKYVLIISTNHNNNEGSSQHVKSREFYSYVKEHFPQWQFDNDFSPKHDESKRMYGDFFHIFKKTN